MLEALILIGIMLVLRFAEPAHGLAIALIAFGALLCVPLFRMYFMNAPPFVPTPKKAVRTMIRLAKIKKGEKAADLGCGDGRVVRAAAEAGASATGYELSLPTFCLAWLLTLATPRASIRFRNFWTQDFSQTDVIFTYLLIAVMKTFKEKIWPQLRPGTRVVSYMFKLPGVEPVEAWDNVYLYVKR